MSGHSSDATPIRLWDYKEGETYFRQEDDCVREVVWTRAFGRPGPRRLGTQNGRGIGSALPLPVSRWQRCGAPKADGVLGCGNQSVAIRSKRNRSDNSACVAFESDEMFV